MKALWFFYSTLFCTPLPPYPTVAMSATHLPVCHHKDCCYSSYTNKSQCIYWNDICRNGQWTLGVFRCSCVKFAAPLHLLMVVAMCGCLSSAMIFAFFYLLMMKAVAAFRRQYQCERSWLCRVWFVPLIWICVSYSKDYFSLLGKFSKIDTHDYVF